MTTEKKGLSTKDIKVGGGLPKTLQPGNVVCKINGMKLEEFTLKEGALQFILSLESKPIEGFEGFLLNKDDQEGPRYAGQVGNVKAGEWAFADGETKTGIQIDRDKEILKFMKNLCIALDCVAWLDSQDGKHATIESLVDAFSKSTEYKDKWLSCCLGGKEYLNKNNYTNYDLFFPKYTRLGAPFGPETPTSGSTKVVVFDAAAHIRKKKTDAVKDFSAEPGSGGPGPDSKGSEFQL